MKKPVPVFLGLVVALVAGALAVSHFSKRPGVSLTLVEYQRWPHGAVIRLTNGSQRTIKYFAEANGTPSPALSQEKTSSGWTNTSLIVVGGMSISVPTGTSNQIFYLEDPAAPPKSGDYLPTLSARDLKPGRSAEFFLRLEPDAYTKRVGTICCVPQGEVAKKLQPFLSRARNWCGLKPTLPGQIEVWCPEELAISSKAQATEGK